MTEGNYERARTQVALALRLSQSRGNLSAKSFDTLDPRAIARKEGIVWTLFMLDRLLLGGGIREVLVPSTLFELPRISYGPSTPDPVSQGSRPDARGSSCTAEMSSQSYNIVQLNIDTFTIWERVIADITQPSSDTDTPLWRHDSRRSAILTDLLDLELSKKALSSSVALLTILQSAGEGTMDTCPLDQLHVYCESRICESTSRHGLTFNWFLA